MDQDEKPENLDLVATWEVPLSSGVFFIQFDHGTTSGKRVIRVNNEEVLRKDWMFKLVGQEEFRIGDHKCRIRIDPQGVFTYRYSLDVDGKPFSQFVERQSKALKTWVITTPDATQLRIVLEKDTLDIWANGQVINTEPEFLDGGTQTNFQVENCNATLYAMCTGIKKQPMAYSLFFNGNEVPEYVE